MAVGQIVSSDVEPERGRARGALLRIRLLSSIGHYPQGTIKSAKGIYHLDEQLAFVAVQTNEQRDHAYWSELTLFAFEEIRFLSALLLSMRPDYGVLRLYPGGAHVTEVISNEVDLHQLAKNLAMNARSVVEVPLAGGRSYSMSGQEIDSKLYKCGRALGGGVRDLGAQSVCRPRPANSSGTGEPARVRRDGLSGRWRLRPSLDQEPRRLFA